jgi:hypothetical protein
MTLSDLVLSKPCFESASRNLFAASPGFAIVPLLDPPGLFGRLESLEPAADGTIVAPNDVNDESDARRSSTKD